MNTSLKETSPTTPKLQKFNWKKLFEPKTISKLMRGFLSVVLFILGAILSVVFNLANCRNASN